MCPPHTPKSLSKNGYEKVFDHAHTDLIDEIKTIWKNDESYEKFTELKRVLMEDHGKKDDLVKLVIFNRVMSLLICVASALLIFYLYVIDLRSEDGRDLR